MCEHRAQVFGGDIGGEQSRQDGNDRKLGFQFGNGLGQLHAGADPQAVLPALRPHVKGALIAAGNLTAVSATAMLDSGLIQLAVFGRPFIGNPDFVERLKKGLPLAALRQDLLYTADAEGYSDYLAMMS